MDAGVLLFNLRLCGIMAGLEVGMMGLLVAGYQVPVPWGAALCVAALPVLGYLLAGEMARRVAEQWRAALLVGALAVNAGLFAALCTAVLGATDPIVLAGIAAAVALLCVPAIRRAVLPVAGDGRR
ncbi:MAG: hypothetical protein AB7Y46_18185 [Armatimonadota bacterium]